MLTESQQRPGCHCAGTAVHPADQNRLRVSLWFPTFPCYPLSLLLHSQISSDLDHFLFGMCGTLHSEIVVSKGSQTKQEETA